jgi:predicted RNA-binding Zn-ribbon protein involved in translation (DUF1610 family)
MRKSLFHRYGQVWRTIFYTDLTAKSVSLSSWPQPTESTPLARCPQCGAIAAYRSEDVYGPWYTCYAGHSYRPDPPAPASQQALQHTPVPTQQIHYGYQAVAPSGMTTFAQRGTLASTAPTRARRDTNLQTCIRCGSTAIHWQELPRYEERREPIDGVWIFFFLFFPLSIVIWYLKKNIVQVGVYKYQVCSTCGQQQPAMPAQRASLQPAGPYRPR